MAILLDLQRVTFEGTDRSLIKHLSVTVSSGDRIGIVGINGSGKSTLLRILSGELLPDGGTRTLGRGVQVAMLEQKPHLPSGSVRDVVGSGWEIDASLDRLGVLGLTEQDTGTLSGGQQKRVALARVFAQPHDVLILDEPTNHLDLQAIEWLELQIQKFNGAVILVSHDRFLLDRVTNRMIEIDRGDTFVHAGGYEKLLENQALRQEQSEKSEAVRKNLAKTELAWLRRGVKARSTKPQARIDAAQRLLVTKADAPARENTLELEIQMPRLGTTVLRCHNVAFHYTDGRSVIHDVTLDLGPGDRVGIVGANGAGKSTLTNLLAQRTQPTVGTVKVGPTVVLSYFDQTGSGIDENLTVQELVAGPHGSPGSLADVALMKRFWFTGALPHSRARELSGGERRRLQLLLALATRPNVLILDEPTNDLDLETIRLIEDFLSDWPGTVVVVSHDRTFLSRTTDRLLEVRLDGTVVDIPGGIDAWIQARSEGQTPADSESGTSASTEPSRGRILRDLEKDMQRMERQIQKLSERLLTITDHEEAGRRGKELTDLRFELSAAEERWLLASLE